MRNRREDERSYIGAQIQIALENNAAVDAKLVDYSSRGVGLILSHSVRRGATVKLIIGVNEFQGVVERSQRLHGDRGYSVGVEIETVS